GRGAPPDGRRGCDERRARQGLVLPADDLRQGRSRDANRAGGDLRAHDSAHPREGRRRGDPCLERDQVRTVVLDLHAGREQGVPRDARSRGRDHVHQRRHDRRRGAPAVRRHEGHGQRPPRSGSGCARRLHRVEVDLRRLQRQAAEGADRHRELKARLSPDGGARGNPGPAAYGYVLESDNGHVLAAHGEAIGHATNNVAEYRALVAGMTKAAELGVRELEVVSDSELLVKQMRGEYRVKNEALRGLWEEANDLERSFARVRYTAVRRAHNELADRLVNEALDAQA